MILHVFNSSIVSGPETLVLPALASGGPVLGGPIEVVFLTEQRLGGRCDAPVAYARSLGHTVHTVNVRGRWDRAAIAELASLLAVRAPRLAHAHDVKASFYLERAARQLRKLRAPARTRAPKIVSTHHGAAYRKGLIRLYEEYYVRMILPKYDAVLTVCTADRISLQNRQVPIDRLHLHLNGVDRHYVDPGERAREQLAIRTRWRLKDRSLPAPTRGLWIGAVARLSAEKRHDRMLNALKTIRSVAPDLDIHLICFGTGSEQERLVRLTNELALDSRVHWMGYSTEIGESMAGLDLLLSLSDGEGIPISLLEAGWSGTPVLSTRVGGIPDLIDDEHGFLVSRTESDRTIGARLASALRDRTKLAEKGRRYQERIVTHFSQGSWLDRLAAIYQDLR